MSMFKKYRITNRHNKDLGTYDEVLLSHYLMGYTSHDLQFEEVIE